jgi:hypothetical protein
LEIACECFCTNWIQTTLLINENLLVFSCNKMEPHLVALTGFDHLNATASNTSIMQVNLFFLIK